MSIKSNYMCNKCNWKGAGEELDFDSTDTCFGEDKIEVCPKCGSMEIYSLGSKSEDLE